MAPEDSQELKELFTRDFTSALTALNKYTWRLSDSFTENGDPIPDGLEARTESVWQHFLNGTFGLCVAEPSKPVFWSNQLEIVRTQRLVLRQLCEDDAAFIHALVNDPDWLRYIGDRGVKTLDDARGYILDGPMTMYKQFGFGLYRVELREGGVPVGLCGLLKREYLDFADIGFAFLPQYRGKGYANEAAAATLKYGMHTLGQAHIGAIVSPDNTASIRLLEKLGLRFERIIRPPNETRDASLYGLGSAT